MIQNGRMTLWSCLINKRTFLHITWVTACCVGAALPVAPSHAGDLVTIEVTGEIEPKCRISAFANAIEFGQISASGTQAATFHVDCNSPFEYRLRSRNGALQNLEHQEHSAGFANRIPYSLEFRLPTDGGLILERCDSATLSDASPSCGGGNSGGGIAISQTASIAVSWVAPSHLVAGTYSDFITLTFCPRI